MCKDDSMVSCLFCNVERGFIKMKIKKVVLFLGILCCSVVWISCAKENAENNSTQQEGKRTEALTNVQMSEIENQTQLSTNEERTKTSIHFENIARRTWVASEWDRDKAYQEISILFTKISDGNIEGYFGLNQFIDPDFDIYSENDKQSGIITGTISNNVADCQLEWKEYGIKGTARIVFKSDDEMEISIKYTEKQDEKVKDEVVTMKPYTLKDMESKRATFKDKSSPVYLKEWGGEINFVSRYRTDNKHQVLFLYLVDKNDRVLYDFSQPIPLPNGINIKEFSFVDLNKDGRKDFILILEYDARVYFQNEYGGFYCEYSMIKN